MTIIPPGTEQIIDGQRMYVTESGRQYFADQWDKINIPSHGIKMKKNKTKGDNSCKKHLWVKGIKSY